jgi:hypothetical protein
LREPRPAAEGQLVRQRSEAVRWLGGLVVAVSFALLASGCTQPSQAPAAESVPFNRGATAYRRFAAEAVGVWVIDVSDGWAPPEGVSAEFSLQVAEAGPQESLLGVVTARGTDNSAQTYVAWYASEMAPGTKSDPLSVFCAADLDPRGLPTSKQSGFPLFALYRDNQQQQVLSVLYSSGQPPVYYKRKAG